MYIKQKLLDKCRGNKDDQKIVALAIYLKSIINKSRLKRYNLHRLCSVTRVPYNTLKNYMPILENNKFIHFEGSGKNKILVLNSLSSRNIKGNIDISFFDFSSYKHVISSLRSFIIIRVQLRKEFIKYVLKENRSPKPNTDYKAVKKMVKKMVRNGVLNSPNQVYEEYGISIERLKKELGCSDVTVIKTIKFAENHGWIIKHRHYVQTYANGVNYYVPENFTFATKNNLYVVLPNTYSIPPALLSSMLSLYY